MRRRILMSTCLAAMAGLCYAMYALCSYIGPKDVIAHASTLNYPDLGKLAMKSDIVVVGRIRDDGNVRHIQQPGSEDLRQYDLPVTVYSMAVEEVLSGESVGKDSVNVLIAGGEMEYPTFRGGPMLKRRIIFAENPLLAKGDHLLLYLQKLESGEYAIVGAGQGRGIVDDRGFLVSTQSDLLASSVGLHWSNLAQK